MEEKKELIEQNQEPIENEEKPNNKKNVFNIIIGISTLLIALLGATFAYFSATARSEEDDVNVKSAYISISYDGGTEIKATNLIPASLNVAINKYRKAIDDADIVSPSEHPYDTYEFIDADEYEVSDEENKKRRCIDANGREVCYVYRFSVKSDGEAGESTQIRGGITVNYNQFDNLSYIVYEVTYRTEGDTILRDKWGNRIVETYRPIDAYRAASDKSALNLVDSTQPDIKFTKFSKPFDVFDNNGEEDDGNYTGTIQPYACLFGYIDGYDGTPTNDLKKCATESVSNDSEEHFFEVLIWLEETGKLQNEQDKEFRGTVALEVPNEEAGSETEGQITGQD